MQVFCKEIIEVEQYQSESNYKLIESNGDWIIYRSEVSSHISFNEVALKPTVDLIFVGVMYFELLNWFNQIIISKPNDTRAYELAQRFDKGFEYLGTSERVFKISSRENSFYIVAANVWIHEHFGQNRKTFFDNFNCGSYLNENIRTWLKII